MLRDKGMVPSEYIPHRLQGDYKDCMECHIDNDILLIWKPIELDIIVLLRYGSHSELFK